MNSYCRKIKFIIVYEFNFSLLIVLINFLLIKKCNLTTVFERNQLAIDSNCLIFFFINISGSNAK